MKVDIISDVHLDFWCRETNPMHKNFEKQIDHLIDICNFGESQAEVLVIAGDLGHYNHQDQALLLKLQNLYKHICLVRGNHDMYLVSNTQKSKYQLNSTNRYIEMKEWCQNKNNKIHYLDGDVISINDIKIAGVGMSWDMSYYIHLTENPYPRGELTEWFNKTMNDGKMIYGGSDNYIIPTAYGGSYYKSSFDPYDYFEKEHKKLQNINDYDNVDIMVSHYVPKHSLIHNDYKDDINSTFYCFDGLKDIQRINPKVWIYGHTHKETDIVEDGVRFICNPLGYPSENTYTSVKTIEIK